MNRAGFSKAILTVLFLCCSTVFAADRRVPSDYPTIQSAIDAAVTGDTVIIAPGTYTGSGNRDIDFKGKAITVRSTDPNDPNIVAATVINCQGSSSNPHGGFYFHTGEDANSILNGLTVTGGYLIYYPYPYDSRGGAILCRNSSPKIANCTIKGNFAVYGGGIYFDNSNPVVIKCTIAGNTANEGGAIYCNKGSLRIIDSVINGNIGGAICCYSANLTVINCIISNNAASLKGAAIYSQSPVLTVLNSTIVGNTAGTSGGAIYYDSGAMFPPACVIGNSIIWGNMPYQIATTNCPACTSLFHCDIQGGWPVSGGGNIDVDPAFVFNSDYHLSSNSPCIDIGSNMMFSLLTDLDGNPRPLDGNNDGDAVADMGAYEYNPDRPSIAVSTSSLTFSYIRGDPKPLPQNFLIKNGGGAALRWKIVENCSWLVAVPKTGILNQDINEVIVSIEPNSLPIGSYKYTLQVSDPNAVNSPVLVQVVLYVGELLKVPQQFSNIQAAINAANNGAVIIVSPGTYTGSGNYNINFLSKAVTVRSIDPNDPNVVASTIIDCQKKGRAFYLSSGEGSASVISGLKITNGYVPSAGGAIYCSGSSPAIKNCIIAANSASDYGGAIYCHGGAPTITGCTISQNKSTLINRSVPGGGGGIYCESASPVINNCTISENVAIEGDGGGITCRNSNPVISNCVFSKNVETIPFRGGGAIYCSSGTLTVANCIIISNSAFGYGGGICCYKVTNLSVITNCIISGNKSSEGGGIACLGILPPSNSSPKIINCTITGNSARGYGGGIYANSSSPIVKNCIVLNNKSPINPQIHTNSQGIVLAEYSNIKGGWSGVGNIDAYPCFAQPGCWDPNGTPTDPNDDYWIQGDYHLLKNSPCVNAGDPNYVPKPGEIDIDGKPRVARNRIDMGAYEFPNTAPLANAGPDQTVYADSNCTADVTLDGSASYDPDGDNLTYIWKLNGQVITPAGGENIVNMLDFAAFAEQWSADEESFQNLSVLTSAWLSTPNSPNWDPQCDITPAGTPAGAIITVNLPLGEHHIQLIVNDGIVDSEPNEVVITVLDNTPPVITLNGTSTIVLECGLDSYTEQGATALDNCAGNVPVIIAGDTVNTSNCVTYLITYTATDSSGNSSQVIRTVIVQDTTPPLLTLNGPSEMVLECCVDSYNEAGAAASDNCAGNMPVIIGGDTVNTSICGTYVITYTATDSSGNSSQVTRMVTVQDTTPPEFTLSVSPTTLWPPNHKMVRVTPSWIVTDNCTQSPQVSLVSITISEEQSDRDDRHLWKGPWFMRGKSIFRTIGWFRFAHRGRHCFPIERNDANDDIRIGDDGSIYLRAERNCISDRIYTITYSAVDDAGNSAESSAAVTVPHDQRTSK